MNNTDMETFWAVLEHGTLTAAAEALFITQPTLTNRIQSLEAEVGAQLFHRGKGIRHIELTEAGQRFLPLAYRWQTLLDETKGVAETATREYLRIGAVFSTNQYILPAAYRRFLHRKLPVALWVQTLRGAGYDGAQTVARRELEMALMDGEASFTPSWTLPLCAARRPWWPARRTAPMATWCRPVIWILPARSWCRGGKACRTGGITGSA